MEKRKATLTRDDFDTWIFEMDDVLEEFLHLLPAAVRQQMDYTPASLDVLSKWLVENYPTMEDIKKPEESHILDGLARYIGETYRKNLDGYWDIDLENDKNVYFCLPVIIGNKAKPTPESPHSLITTTIARKDETLMQRILLNMIRKKL